MKGRVFPRGETWSYVHDLPPNPVTGKRRQKMKGGFRLEGEAAKAMVTSIDKVNKGKYVENKSMTVAEYLTLYLEVHAEPNFKPTSYDTEKTIIESRIIPVLGKTKLQELSPLAIKQFYAGLSKKYSSDYVRNIHGVMRRAMRLAYTDFELLEANIMDKVKTPKVEKKEMDFWTLEEWTHFLDVASYHRHYIFFSLAIRAGMRRGEVLGLRWRDIDFNRKTITVQQQVNWTRAGIIFQKVPKTKGSNRKVELDEFLIQELKERRKVVVANKLQLGEAYSKHDLVCCYENGEPLKPKRIEEAMDVLSRKAEVKKIRIHDLRHTHASFLLYIGTNPKVAAERLGMSPQQFNERYSHLLPTMQKETVSRIEEALKAQLETKTNEESVSKSVDKKLS